MRSNWWSVTLDCGCVVSLDAAEAGGYNSSEEWENYGEEPVGGRMKEPCAIHRRKK
jgi:hypothetical protein